MSRLFFLFSCLAALGGCGSREMHLSLKEFSSGSLSLALNTAGHAILSLGQPDGGSYCPILTGTVTARLNGSPPINFFPGGLGPVEGEGYRACSFPAFDFALTALDASPGAPDGEFVIEDGSYAMRLTARDVATERKLIPLIDPAMLKPGSQMKFGWQPGTDSGLNGFCVTENDGDRSYTARARVEAGQFIVDLSHEPWPAGSVLFCAGYAIAPLVKCEGVRQCGEGQMLREVRIGLPTL